MSTHTPWGTTEAAALAYAATLDRAFAQAAVTEKGRCHSAVELDNSIALEAALLAVGDLLGGLSVHGFAADLAAHLERVEASMIEDAPRWDYRPSFGNDPDVVFSTRLSDAIDQAREDDA